MKRTISFGGIFNRFAYKTKTPVKKTIISLIIVAVLEFAAFYAFLPPLNIYSMEFWQFQGVFAVMFLIPEFEMQKDLKELSKKYGVSEDIAYYREQIFLD